LTIAKFRNFNEKSVIDVGTGAGFPGLPIKIFFENSNVTLLDSLNKRINFLKDVSNNIGLKNINFIHSRAEDAGQNKLLRESFDFCVSRAVANLSVLAEYDLPFVKIGGEFIALKGPTVNEEISDAKNAIKILGGEITDIKDIALPFSDITHKLVFIQKLRQTPNQYPRKAGKISKSPIK
ncbi:MAG: 16S rRNA (guanine(527)-N(7))-methyltransferase RsmG, partial [Eubacteriales bacterium]|nr:16S rRNA (guanine(527)-N(7))-methyltransferase RsmG [Eubacteriales bacterium]